MIIHLQYLSKKYSDTKIGKVQVKKFMMAGFRLTNQFQCFGIVDAGSLSNINYTCLVLAY